MTDLILTNAHIVTPQRAIESAWLLCQNGKIAAAGTGQPPTGQTFDTCGLTLLPGFIDVHVHGACGVDTMDASADALHAMARFFATRGVTSFLPTTITADHRSLVASLHAVKEAMQAPPEGAQILGAHLEGPYLNPDKCGAQDKTFIRRVDPQEAAELLDVGVIRLVSLAPEYQENHWLIEECHQRGITVSAAHTQASYQAMQDAVELGITHATHTFNAMPQLHHREPGAMAALMLDERVRCELIADNIHVHPAMMHLLYRLKGADKLVLVTDSMRAAGMDEGTYRLGNYDVTVAAGKATLADGTLAGSVLTLDVALQNLSAATGADFSQLWRTVSLNPAEALGISDSKGSIEIGKDADLTLVDEDGMVHLTVVGGEIAYQR